MKLRVTYAKSSYKDRTYSTPLVQYSYRDENGTPRHKTVLSLSKLPAYVVKVIDEALKRGDTSILNDYAPVSSFHYEESVNVGASFAAHKVMDQVGIVDALRVFLTPARAVASLSFVQERITAEKPLSISALWRQFDDDPYRFLLGSPKNPALNTWYSALESLEKYREQILCNLQRKSGQNSQLFLYDITSSYFEGVKCPLAAFGYNRDGKKGKMQVVIGVITDGEGQPVWCNVFKGNTSDQTTVREQLVALREKLQVKKFIFVGDRGMVTNARIKELDKEGWWEVFSYITALKRSEMIQLVEDEKHPMQLELFDYRNLMEFEHDGDRYVLCHNPHRKSQDAEIRNRLLTLTEEKLAAIQNSIANGRVKKKEAIAKRLYRWLNRWNMERFFNVEYDEGFLTYERNEIEIERYSRLDGCYVIRSNVKEDSLSKEQLQQHYKELKYVEQAFRTMKTTDIEVRPIRVWTENHVRGYIFGCFLAYRVIWEVRKRLESMLDHNDKNKTTKTGSLQEVWRSLMKISVGIFSIAENRQLELSNISKINRKILKLLKITTILNFQF